MTDMDAALLEFEDTHPKHDGRKEAAIRARFGVTPARYYQKVHRLLSTKDGVEKWPMLARRMRGIGEKRAARVAR